MQLYVANRQWMNRPQDERYTELSDLRQAVHGRRLRSRSVDIDSNRIAIAEKDGALIVNSSIEPAMPSYWAFGQLCAAAKLNGTTPPANYLRELGKAGRMDLAVQCLNEGLKNGDREAHKFMTIAPSGESAEEIARPNTLQAVTSTTYGRIWDADVVDAVQRIVDRSNGKFSNPKDWSGKKAGLYASDHDVFIFMVDGGSILDGGDRAQLHRGFITWNSETGSKTFGLMTFLFNVVCGNHIIWGAQNVNKLVIRHTSGGPNRFDVEASPALNAYVNESATPVLDTIRKAQAYLLPDFSQDTNILLNFVDKAGVNLKRGELLNAVNFAKSEEGECRTLWQLVQGATAYARGFDYIDSRVDLEKRASKLLNLAAN